MNRNITTYQFVQQKINLFLWYFYDFLRSIFLRRYIKEIKELGSTEKSIFKEYSGLDMNQDEIVSYVREWDASICADNNTDFYNINRSLALRMIAGNIGVQLIQVGLYRHLKKVLKFDINFMDFGCCSATMSFLFKDRFRKAYFVEADEESLEYISFKIKKLNPDNFKGLHPDQLDEIDNNSLDFVLAYDVFEHIEDPSPTIAAIDKKIKVGGYLLYRAPWGGTFFGNYPNHGPNVKNNFMVNGGAEIVSQKYRRIKSISIIDFYYKQGLFQKVKT